MKKLGFDLIILGSPVSGKDTQAALLRHYYDLKPVKSGDYLRKLRSSPRYRKIFAQTYDRGLPVPSKIIDDFIRKNILRAPKGRNLMFVGCPRLRNEAVLLTKLMKQKNRDYFVIYIRLPDKEIQKRSFHRDREENDLDLGYIKNRINYHKKQVKETVIYFQKLNKLKYINGMQSILNVSRDISKAIHDYQRSQAN